MGSPGASTPVAHRQNAPSRAIALGKGGPIVASVRVDPLEEASLWRDTVMFVLLILRIRRINYNARHSIVLDLRIP